MTTRHQAGGTMTSNSMTGTTMHELQAIIDKVNRLCAAMRASGLKVEVTSHVSLNFEVRVDEPKKKAKNAR
jgi:hypothetical protein